MKKKYEKPVFEVVAKEPVNELKAGNHEELEQQWEIIEDFYNELNQDISREMKKIQWKQFEKDYKKFRLSLLELKKTIAMQK
jgi:hypothetical protein